MKVSIRSQQLILALIGVAIVLFTLRIPEQWVAFQPGSINQLLLLLLGVLLAAIALLGNRFPVKQLQKGYQVIAVVLLNTLVIVLFVEMLVTLSVNLKYQYVLDGQVVAGGWDIRQSFPYFKQVEWGSVYWQEHRQRKTNFASYTMWREAEQKGETINIDINGFRMTPNTECRENAYNIWMFGGSALWGEGVPDWNTIPAYIQNALAEEKTEPICVRNYAEGAYVSTQEVAQLMLLLRAGNIPDMVVFYNGFNDVFSSFQNGKAGEIQNMESIRSNLENNSVPSAMISAILNSYTFQVLSGLVLNQGSSGVSTENQPQLASDTIAVYRGNYDLVEHLGDAYGFKVIWFWQPSLLLTNKPLTSIEQGILAPQDKTWIELNREVHNGLLVDKPAYLYDLTDSFDQETRFIWFDNVHVVSEGNLHLATLMVEVIQQEMS